MVDSGYFNRRRQIKNLNTKYIFSVSIVAWWQFSEVVVMIWCPVGRLVRTSTDIRCNKSTVRGFFPIFSRCTRRAHLCDSRYRSLLRLGPSAENPNRLRIDDHTYFFPSKSGIGETIGSHANWVSGFVVRNYGEYV